jgi:hypothetical protein
MELEWVTLSQEKVVSTVVLEKVTRRNSRTYIQSLPVRPTQPSTYPSKNVNSVCQLSHNREKREKKVKKDKKNKKAYPGTSKVSKFCAALRIPRISILDSRSILRDAASDFFLLLFFLRRKKAVLSGMR